MKSESLKKIKAEWYKIDKKGDIVTSTRIKSYTKSKDLDFTIMNVGYYVIAPLLIGLFLGLMIDGKFNSKPIGTIIGISLGSIGSFYNLSKFIHSNA